MRSYRTDDYVPRLYFESSRANNFNETWIVKLNISCNDHSPSNPTMMLNRSISFQLVMKSRPNHPKDIHFMVVKAPGSDYQVLDHVVKPSSPVKLSWSTWLICIVLHRTTWRRLISIFRCQVQLKWIEWLDQGTSTFEFTSSKLIKKKETINDKDDPVLADGINTRD